MNTNIYFSRVNNQVWGAGHRGRGSFTLQKADKLEAGDIAQRDECKLCRHGSLRIAGEKKNPEPRARIRPLYCHWVLPKQHTKKPYIFRMVVSSCIPTNKQ